MERSTHSVRRVDRQRRKRQRKRKQLNLNSNNNKNVYSYKILENPEFSDCLSPACTGRYQRSIQCACCYINEGQFFPEIYNIGKYLA